MQFYLTLLLSAIAITEVHSKWSNDCRLWDCKCEFKNGKNFISCTHLNMSRPPLNGFRFPNGTQLVDLSFNRFYALENYSFYQFDPEEVAYILELNMSSSLIQRIAKNAFIHFDNLLTLDLSHNKIGGLLPDTFQNMKKLEYLYLQHNRLTMLSENTFSGLNSLKILDLSSCGLHLIEWWAFSFSDNPTLLNLKNNSLTTFHSNYVYTPTNFQLKINLIDNPIRCDCEIKRIFKDYTFNGDVGDVDFTCSYPEHLKGYHFSALMLGDFINCRETFFPNDDNTTIVGVVNTTTTLSCKTISGAQFRNWSIVRRADHLTELPDRFTVSQSRSWINLTIVNTSQSDAGEYMCGLSERLYGTLRRASERFTVIVTEDVVSALLVQNDGGNFTLEGSKELNDINGTTEVDQKLVEKPDNFILWLVICIVTIITVFSTILLYIFVRQRRNGNKSEQAYALCSVGSARSSHTYEDLDIIISRLKQRSVPEIPSNENAIVGPPVEESTYIQHEMIVKPPFWTPISLLSPFSEVRKDEGPFDNEMYLQPKPSPTPSQTESRLWKSTDSLSSYSNKDSDSETFQETK